MSHFSVGRKDQPQQLITDGKWHHLPLLRPDELDPRYRVTVQNGWVVAIAPWEPGRYDLQQQLNGQAGVTTPNGAYDALLQPETQIEWATLRWPIATSADGLTARGSTDTLRRQPRYAWADTLRADIEINPPGSGDSERVGIDYKVKGGVVWSFDVGLKFTRQFDIEVR